MVSKLDHLPAIKNTLVKRSIDRSDYIDTLDSSRSLARAEARVFSAFPPSFHPSAEAWTPEISVILLPHRSELVMIAPRFPLLFRRWSRVWMPDRDPSRVSHRDSDLRLYTASDEIPAESHSSGQLQAM